MSALRVFLADDHGVVREGLKLLLKEQPGIVVVGEACDGQSALENTLALRPDVLVIDISMPVVNGADVTVRLKAAEPSIKVLALSVHEESSYIRALFAAGANGYVLKRSAAEVLIQAVRSVAAGETYLDPLIAGKVVDRVVHAAPLVPERQAAMLSEREFEVLQQVAQGYSSKEIATKLNLSSKTVETYKARAMEKLGLNGRAAIVRYAIAQGWLQQTP